MSHPLKLTPEALNEETDAYNYYEDVRTGLGESLLLELEKCYTKVANTPFYYSYLENSEILRHIRVSRYPYIIIYVITANAVIILSVRNTHRQPFI